MPRKPSPLTVAKNKLHYLSVELERESRNRIATEFTNSSLRAQIAEAKKVQDANPFRSLQIVVTDEKGKQLSAALYSVNKGDHFNFVVDSDGDTSVQSSFDQ